MQRIMTIVWMTQATLSLVMAVAYFAVPARWHRLFHNVDLPRMLSLQGPTVPHGVSAESMLVAVSVLRSDADAIVTAMRLMSAPAMLLAFMSFYAAMREDEDTRRYIARTFGLVLSAWAATLAFKAPIGVVIKLGSHVYRSPSGPHTLHNANESKFFYVVALFAVINFAHGFVPAHHRRERPLSGVANTRPQLLWVLWFLQGTFMLVAAAVIMWTTRGSRRIDVTLVDESLPRVADCFRDLHLGASGLPYQHLLGDVVEALPPMCVAIALFTFYAMMPSRQWVWRTLAGTFSVHFGALVVLSGLVYQPGLLRPWVLPVVAIPSLVLCAWNLYFSLVELEYFTRETDGPDGWVANDLVLGPALLAKTILSRGRRARNAAGIGARGRLEVWHPSPVRNDAAPGDSMVPTPLARAVSVLPAHEFFEFTKNCQVVARFSNATSEDDAALDARGVALEITNEEDERFVILLSTGAYNEAPHVFGYLLAKLVATFGRLVPRFMRVEAWVRREAAVGALRRAPPSYLTLAYHSQTVRFWVGKDDVRYLVRFRLLPCDLPRREAAAQAHATAVMAALEDEARATEARHAREARDDEALEATLRRERTARRREERLALDKRIEAVVRECVARAVSIEPGSLGPGVDEDDRERAASERRGSDYLRNELRRTLETQRANVGTDAARAKMLLQAQLHRFANGDTSHWYNPAVDWRGDEHPWLDVGTLVLHTVMPDDEAESLCFDLSYCPHSLGIPAGMLPTDFRSLGDTQRRVVGRVQAVRAWMLAAFGVPGPLNAPKDR